MKFYLKKIISGGQTGVDVGALEAAVTFGISCGGWCPPDLLNEEGLISKKFGLVPTKKDRSPLAPDIPRSMRTEWNVRDSDGTLVICLSGHPAGLGTTTTLKLTKLYHKPVLELCLPDTQAISIASTWLNKFKLSTLNLAGPSESEAPGIQQLTFEFVLSLLQQVDKGNNS